MDRAFYKILAARIFFSASLAGILAQPARPGEPPAGDALDLRTLFEKGIPPSPFADVAYRFADCLLERGRDVHGPLKTGLFLSALDRKTLSPLEPLRAKPGFDASLFRLLYVLSELSGDPKYAKAADEGLRFCLEHLPSPETGLLPWGRGAYWEANADVAVLEEGATPGELARPWVFFARGFELDPEASLAFARAVSHSAASSVQALGRERGISPRGAGFWIRILADAWAKTREAEFLETIGSLLDVLEEARGTRSSAERAGPGSLSRAPAESRLSLAIDCDGAARKAPEPWKARLRRLAVREDEAFLSLPHDLRGRGGFARRASEAEPIGAAAGAASKEPDPGFTSLWEPGPGGATTATVAMMCVSRYENTGDVRYRDLIIDAAEAYQKSLPDAASDAWPMTLGQAVSLELAAFRETARARFYRRALQLAEFAVERLFGESPLPRASLRSERYESMTGAGALALSLVELHLLTRHISAVRAPSNTLER